MVKNDNTYFILKIKDQIYCYILHFVSNRRKLYYLNVPAFLDGPLREPDNICLMKLCKYFEMGDIIHGQNKKCCFSSFYTFKPNLDFLL